MRVMIMAFGLWPCLLHVHVYVDLGLSAIHTDSYKYLREVDLPKTENAHSLISDHTSVTGKFTTVRVGT